jgi:hypothetical protein
MGRALLLDRLSVLDDISAGQVPARLNLGDTLGPADMTLLSAIADGWPALRAHFGAQPLTRLSEDPQFNHDNGMTWNYLALVAGRQQLLSRELAQAVTDQPALLNNDGVLAWYARTYRWHRLRDGRISLGTRDVLEVARVVAGSGRRG